MFTHAEAAADTADAAADVMDMTENALADAMIMKVNAAVAVIKRIS